MIIYRLSNFAILSAGIVIMFLFSGVSCSTPPPGTSVMLDVSTTKRLECKDWRVRYCLATEGRRGTDVRVVLERLIRDSNERVANQAAVWYLYTFVHVDRTFLRDHVGLFYRLPVGVDFGEKPNISSIDFHKAMLALSFMNVSPRVEEHIQAIGILGDKPDADVIRPFLSNNNLSISYKAAIAIARLGLIDEAVTAILQQIKQPASDESIHYQIESLRILAELDINSFQHVFPEFAERVKNQEWANPGIWWSLTQIAWDHGLEINGK